VKTLPGKHHLNAQWATKQLAEAGDQKYLELFEHGTLKIEVYAPAGHDPQQPHRYDEVYVVIAGTGTFLNDDQRTPFTPGDLLFVPAGVVHRFEGFSDDFATWVMFYGPEGGE
jgi:mannose-6-phosphate isomerase-like protein (cupin superfamily)